MNFFTIMVSFLVVSSSFKDCYHCLPTIVTSSDQRKPFSSNDDGQLKTEDSDDGKTTSGSASGGETTSGSASGGEISLDLQRDNIIQISSYKYVQNQLPSSDVNRHGTVVSARKKSELDLEKDHSEESGSQEQEAEIIEIDDTQFSS
uniref:Cnidarian restricted protein n=1 Tax=Clytia hemisphaerica TaxID=252671 RepID=A0A7M5XIL6_9CNID